MEIGRAQIEVQWLLGRPVKPGDDTLSAIAERVG
jgi:hypothetical protein